jgi:hypothetical protein
VMSFAKPKVQAIHGVDEVRFKNHSSEFRRFFENHKSFCDEVSGIKPRTIFEGVSTKQFYIGRENFIFAIRKLIAFVVDNLHYVKSYEDAKDLENKCLSLERPYNSL